MEINKKEFLYELEKNLKGLPKDDLEDRLSFYSEMIDDIVSSGKSEEEAVNELGGVNKVIADIAKDMPLKRLVQERIRTKKKMSGLMILLLILGFPLWFPLLITLIVLVLVLCLLTWVFVLVALSIEIAFIVSSIGIFIGFIAYLFNSQLSLTLLGTSLVLAALSIFFAFAFKYIVVLNVRLNKKIFIGLKRSLIKGGNKNE